MVFNILRPQYLRDTISVDLNIDKSDFISRFRNLIDADRGIFMDQFISSNRDYLGKIDNDGFILRRKRNFLGPLFSANAKGKILGLKAGTRLEIEIRAYDPFTSFGLLLAPIVFFVLITVVVINKAYPVLFFLIPLFLSLLLFQRILGKKTLINFKRELSEKLSRVY